MSATDPSHPGWKLLRIVPNDGGAGSFSDDTDWCSTAVDLPVDESTGVQRYRSDSSAPVTAVEVVASAFDAGGARIARGSGTLTLTGMQWVRRPEQDRGTAAGVTVYSVPQTTVPLESPRQFRLAGEVERFSVRLSAYTSMPGTANHIRVYWRDV